MPTRENRAGGGGRVPADPAPPEVYADTHRVGAGRARRSLGERAPRSPPRAGDVHDEARSATAMRSRPGPREPPRASSPAPTTPATPHGPAAERALRLDEGRDHAARRARAAARRRPRPAVPPDGGPTRWCSPEPARRGTDAGGAARAGRRAAGGPASGEARRQAITSVPAPVLRVGAEGAPIRIELGKRGWPRGEGRWLGAIASSASGSPRRVGRAARRSCWARSTRSCTTEPRRTWPANTRRPDDRAS